MHTLFADLHIHIGRSGDDRPVKITASRDLTFEGICRECVDRKGVQVAGVIDCASPAVIADIEHLVETGEMEPLSGGGLRYRSELVVLLGAELETHEEGGGLSHHVCYLPDVPTLKRFSADMARKVTNMQLSSQQCHMPANLLAKEVLSREGLFVPAHAFTPHKSLYGSCAARMAEMFEEEVLAGIPAIELGLSADTSLADRLSELSGLSFLSNSDAHSLPKIAREYNILKMPEASFAGLRAALEGRGEAGVLGNFGLDPRLGKYHRTFCEVCDEVVLEPPPTFECSRCAGDKVTRGVLDRIVSIADREESRSPGHRPPYRHQVPLEFVPGLGSVKLNALLNRFGTEMNVLHEADEDEIAQVVGSKIARLILHAREGRLAMSAGGGGRFGKALPKADDQLPLGL
ncbi:MAG: TIGR00375 family protein [Armatimonadia bacterium]|nr:TIGR00375 family protein [Armatimonadia bacterium]